MKKLLNKKHFQKEIEPVDTTSHIIATVLLSVFIPLLILGIIGLKGAISKNNASIETESIIETETENLSSNPTKLVSGVIADIQPNLTDIVTEPNSENDVKVEIPKNEILSGYCTTNVNVRKLADVNSDSITVLQFNTPIYYTKSSNNDEWVKVSYNGDWINTNYKEEVLNILHNTNFKKEFPSVSTPYIADWQIYKYIKEMIPDIE